MENRSALNNIDGYRRLFLDAAFWQPAVQAVLQRHGLQPAAPVETGAAGTCPTFIVGRRWVVKFFGRLFNGGESFRVEAEANRLAALDPAIPRAAVAAAGELGDSDWPWPYLIFAYIDGQSTGQLAEQIDRQGWQQIAADLGRITRRLHALPLAGSRVFDATGTAWRAFLQEQRAQCVRNHRGWDTLPKHWIAQIEPFLPPLEDLAGPVHLIHADLTSDHLLGRIENGRWQTLALIDFGDALAGDLYYELGPLYLDLFGCDRETLRVFLDAYGVTSTQRAVLPRRALASALLHQFNLFENVPEAAFQAKTLNEFAGFLYG